MQYYCDAVTRDRVQSSVLMLLFDLAHCDSTDELADLIGSSS